MHKIAVGVVVAALALAACGGSSKSNSSSGGKSGGNSSTTASGGGSDEFSQLVAKAKSADFKVTYTTDGKSQTFAQDGKGKSAMITDDSLIISDGTKTISCDGRTSSATCTDLGAGGAGALSGLTAIFTSAYAGLAALKSSTYGGHTSSQTIAGRDATCVTIKSSDFAGPLSGIAGKITGQASVTYCVDKNNGTLLKLSGTDASGKETDTLVATAAGPSSASDFVPPSTPATIPTGVSIPTP